MKVNVKPAVPLLALALLLWISVSSRGRSVDPQEPQPNQAQPGAFDPIERLGLTPEQRQKFRAIREQTKNERAAINQRVRESNIALEQALDADHLDEALIDERTQNLAAAQAAQLRMRIQTEVMIRRILSPEQLATLRSLRLQLRDVMGGQHPNRQRPVRPNVDGLRPNQGNGMAPIFPRPNVTPRSPRP
jgi:Spy/CpxP family protein refolding chaperone